MAARNECRRLVDNIFQWLCTYVAFPVCRYILMLDCKDSVAAFIYAAAFISRLVAIGLGLWLDTFAIVKYSDVDYSVYSDAAREIWAGGSPYDRATYRYTPLLAWLLLPNVWAPEWGKLLFTVADHCIGQVTARLLAVRGEGERAAALLSSAFLLHPFAINVSTRGNADSIVCLLVLATLYAMYRKKVDMAAVVYGLAVHVKIYPIIYALPLVLFLDSNCVPEDFIDTAPPESQMVDYSGSRISIALGKPVAGLLRWCLLPVRALCAAAASAPCLSVRKARLPRIHAAMYDFFTPRRVGFGMLSLAVFSSVTALYYWLYGWTFLYETYLYHFARVDARHNFSPYFYDLYLRSHNTVIPQDADGTSFVHSIAAWLKSPRTAGILAFLPQFGTILIVGSRYYADLAFALFLQTWIFVAWNKVITVQYFHWYLALAPLILPQNFLGQARVNPRARRVAIGLGLAWLGTELHWNFWAYWLELIGQCTFLQVWMAGLLFFAANVYIIAFIMRHHTYQPVFRQGALQVYQQSKKAA